MKTKILVPETGIWNTWDDFLPYNSTCTVLQEKVENYLQKENKIISLAKERIQVKKKELDVLFETLKPGDGYEEAIIKKSKHYLQLARDGNIEELNKNEYGHVFEQFSIRFLTEYEMDARYLCTKTSKKGCRHKYLIEALDYEGNKYRYICGDTGCKTRYQNDVWHNTRSGATIACTDDLGRLMAKLYVAKLVSDIISDEEFDLSEIEPDLRNVYKLQGEEDMYSYLPLPVFGTRQAAVEVLGKTARDVSFVSKCLMKAFFERKLISPEPCNARDDFYYMFCDNSYRNGMDKIIKLIVEKATIQKRNRVYEGSVNADYAKSFQTKKNISKKVLKAMEESKFNDFFGFVEFDELVDLEQVCEIEKEFRSFIYFLFGKDKGIAKDAALRFRRLGNHKASGLYYPGFNCICVDINKPSSFIHEYGHMLDFTNGKASEKKEFCGVLKLYEELLRGYLNDNKIILKGKYNIDYYLTPTEVYARTFEIYMKKIRGMDNSILGDCEGFAYPDDKLFLMKVSDYFTNFFCLDKNNEDAGGDVKCAST